MDFTQILSAMRKSSGDNSPIEVKDIDYFKTKDIKLDHSPIKIQVGSLSPVNVSNLNLDRPEVGASYKGLSVKRFLNNNFNVFTKE